MKSTLKRTWAEIDLSALSYNYNRIREHIGDKVKFLGVVKADAYGHGAVPVAKALEDLADYYAVAMLEALPDVKKLYEANPGSKMMAFHIEYAAAVDIAIMGEGENLLA